jgi:hypothetical protein
MSGLLRPGIRQVSDLSPIRCQFWLSAMTGRGAGAERWLVPLVHEVDEGELRGVQHRVRPGVALDPWPGGAHWLEDLSAANPGGLQRAPVVLVVGGSVDAAIVADAVHQHECLPTPVCRQLVFSLLDCEVHRSAHYQHICQESWPVL